MDGRLRKAVDIDKMQHGFMAQRGTADSVFVLRRHIEQFKAKNKKFFFAFADLEKVFDWVPRKVIRFALRQSVSGYLINGVISFYQGCKTAASVDGELSNSFSLKFGYHQGSALSPLLFIMVMDVLIEDLSDGSIMDFVVCRRSYFVWGIIK